MKKAKKTKKPFQPVENTPTECVATIQAMKPIKTKKTKKTEFQKCIDFIRGMTKEDWKKLRKDANSMFGKDTKIVIP